MTNVGILQETLINPSPPCYGSSLLRSIHLEFRFGIFKYLLSSLSHTTICSFHYKSCLLILSCASNCISYEVIKSNGQCRLCLCSIHQSLSNAHNTYQTRSKLLFFISWCKDIKCLDGDTTHYWYKIFYMAPFNIQDKVRSERMSHVACCYMWEVPNPLLFEAFHP